MSEYKGITITDEQEEFRKKNGINLSWLTQRAINRAMCKRIITLRPDQQEWLESQHLNLNLIVQAAIDGEMNGHG